MSLNPLTLKANIKAAFVAAGGEPVRSDAFAEALAVAIDTYVKSATVVPTLMISGGPGAPVTGVGALT